MRCYFLATEIVTCLRVATDALILIFAKKFFKSAFIKENCFKVL